MNATEPLTAAAPLQGVFWSWVVPIALFLLAFGATWALYRHFAAKPPAGGAPERPRVIDDRD